MTDTGATDLPPPVDERTAWFTEFGYNGTEDVTLRGSLGTATADEVWKVLEGLRTLERDFNSLWVRAVGAAHSDRRPSDPDGDLGREEYGELTDERGNWHNERRRIVMALVREFGDDGEVGYATDPLERKVA